MMGGPMVRIIVLLLCVLCGAGSNLLAEDRFERITPEEVGYSTEKLAELAAFLEERGSSALLLVHDGKVFFEWGDIYRKHTVHSIRKALLNSVFGIHVARGDIDLDATLSELGIDDIEPRLTEAEKQATVRHLIASRSGIYHAAAADNDGMHSAKPDRGSHAPGAAYHYNNWDFNAAGTIFERLADRSIYEAFYREIAVPLGMLHFRGTHARVNSADPDASIPDTDGFYQFEPARSRFPAYHFRLSAHDLALYGQLYMNRGRWQGVQLVPADWVDLSTKVHSVSNPRYGLGYGLLWGVLVPGDETTRPSFYHTGTNVHMLGVYPEHKLVMVHRVDTEHDYRFTEFDLYEIIRLVHGARR